MGRMGVGAAAALLSAALWAATNLILRRQVLKIGGATANTWRNVFATLCFTLIFLSLRRPSDLLGIAGQTLGVLLLSVLLSMVIGDILQFTAIRRLGIALAMPIASCYPLLTLVIAALSLGETIRPRAVGGAVLVVAGVVLVALPRRALEADATRQAFTTNHWIGVGLALASALCAAGATTLTRVAIIDLDLLAANMIRLPFSAAVCAVISVAERRQPPWRIERWRFAPLCLAGLLAMGSGICYLNAIKLVGAAQTATLNAAAPIFGLIGAVIFLGERPTQRNVVGAIIAFIGIALVI